MILGSVLYILPGWTLQSVSLVKQAVSRKDRLLFCFRREGLRDMLKRQFSHFRFEECMRKKDRAAESIVEGVWKRVEGMVLYSQFKVSRSRHSQQRCLLAWPECCWCCYRGRGECMLVALHVVLSPESTAELQIISCELKLFVVWRDHT